jgi:hypothetical protein
MKPYIYGLRNKIHVVDIRETVKGLLLAKKFVQRVVAEGKDVCFVGTKRQARAAVEKYAQDVGMPYVIERWLGGTLTNYRTIRERLARLEELEKLVESGEIENYSKKMASQLLREQRKITRNLQGIRNMDKHPGGPRPGHPHHRPDRHRRRSGPGRHSHPRQRRLDAVDRRGGSRAVRGRHRGQGRPDRRGREREASRGACPDDGPAEIEPVDVPGRTALR